VQEIIGKQIQESLEIVHVDEEAYLNELVAYWLHFEGYKYDWLIGKLVEVLINVFQKKFTCATSCYSYKFSEQTYYYHHLQTWTH
jgi:hypothetical protein